MKKFKGTIILGIILIAVATYAYVFEVVGGRKREAAEKEAVKVFHFDKLDVEEITVKRQDEEQPEIFLTKIAGTWWLKKPLDYKAETSFVNALLSNFDVAENKRTVTKDISDLSKFGLDPPQAQYIIKHKDGVDTLYLGTKNPIGNFTFAYKPPEKEVFLTYNAMLDKANSEIFKWRSKSILEYETDQINKISLKNTKNTFEAVKATAEEWNLEKPIVVRADKSEIDKILNKIKNAQIKEFVEEHPKNLRKYGLHRPSIQLDVIKTVDESKQTLYIGNQKKDDGNYYARAEAREPVFLVDSTVVNRLQPTLFALRDKSVIDSKSKDVFKLELLYEDTTIVCTKDSLNEWFVVAPQEGKAKNWKVNGVISDLEYLKVEKFLDYSGSREKSYGVDSPPVEVVLSSKDAVLERVKLGKEVNGQRYFYNVTRGKLYLVRGSIINDLKFHVKDLLEESVAESENEEKE